LVFACVFVLFVQVCNSVALIFMIFIVFVVFTLISKAFDGSASFGLLRVLFVMLVCSCGICCLYISVCFDYCLVWWIDGE